ncbi:hypothetical protein NDU88_006202 [Pleurodeles waltl]|uniref:Uncharacterized protein n=1 Tax=Pleurodeles waltl TaxID=8319 RepID=A0AAV7TD95_PLEWA|nr:hypothetical protein NDU88_006202 [Pleurodeles waltl]
MKRRRRRLTYLRCCILDQWEYQNGVPCCRQESTPLLSYLVRGRIAQLGGPPSQGKGSKTLLMAPHTRLNSSVVTKRCSRGSSLIQGRVA